MEHTIKLHTRENGRFVEKTVAAPNHYFSISPYMDSGDDVDEIDVLSAAAIDF